MRSSASCEDDRVFPDRECGLGGAKRVVLVYGVEPVIAVDECLERIHQFAGCYEPSLATCHGY